MLAHATQKIPSNSHFSLKSLPETSAGSQQTYDDLHASTSGLLISKNLAKTVSFLAILHGSLQTCERSYAAPYPQIF